MKPLNQAAQSVRTPAVTESLGNLDRAVTRLEEDVTSCIERLQMVLAPQTEPCGPVTSVPHVATAPLAEKLDAVADRVIAVSNLLKQTIDRVEL